MSRPAKRRRLSPPALDPSQKAPPSSILAPADSAFARSAEKWDLEQAYEQRPRKLKKSKEVTKLPIRTDEGWVEQEVSQASDNEEVDSFLTSDRGIEQASTEEEEVQQAVPSITPKQQVFKAKEELARLATLVNEDPEEHVGSLRTIANIGESANVTVKKLALATQLAVYKDIIPGYRIRPHTEEDAKAKLSKEVRRLRNFEQSLVGGYQQYLQVLSEYATRRGAEAAEEQNSLASVAISCACNLLLAVPHFNFRGELLKILVSKLSSRSKDADFYKCVETLETMFATDEDGTASLDAVTTLTKMTKAKHYLVDEAVLNTFLHLRLLSEFSHKGSHAGVDKDTESTQGKDKKQKEKREFRTKKQRKILREQKVVEKEMKEADATVSHEERDRMQAETLKLVFVTYFRVLKARTPSLTGAVLEGLARYAHLINQDFFGDILEALRDIISRADNQNDDDEEIDESIDDQNEDTASNVSRESLLCVITAFALLEGQDASAASTSLNLDLNFFITHLYRTLFPASLNPDIELSAKSHRLPDPTASDPETQRPSSNKVNVQTTTVLLIRSLSSALLPASNVRAVPPTRIAAFAKNLMTASLQLPEKSSLAMLGLMQKVVKVHGRKITALWHTEERKGDGAFDALRGEGGGEGSNPFAATVWEGEILKMHFCPKVRDAVKHLERGVVDAR
ncbi:nucleolar complex protein-like protein 3 [Rhizodiscina lignyota]|uniref:Nucleolar complex-associated protein 3 n=1 Tax=Rhizodiscina lignyota TaxID=1504668 RepID=A0A9P4M7W4_9PEZI|nr:nucleolar complex protein-like protein 3 [Rhizodiscina lignyota]